MTALTLQASSRELDILETGLKDTSLRIREMRRFSFELEYDLREKIQTLERTKVTHLSFKNVLLHTFTEFKQQASKNRAWTTCKVFSLGTLVLGSLHPLFLGTVACLVAYRLVNWLDLFSDDAQTAIDASLLFSNMGHAVEYMMNVLRLFGLFTRVNFSLPYQKAKVELMTTLYDQFLQTEALTEKEKDFIADLKKRELFLISKPGTLISLQLKNARIIEWQIKEKGIFKKIELQKKELFKSKNMIRLTARALLKETRQKPWMTFFKSTLIGTVTLCSHPLLIGTIACLNAYRYNSQDLYSSDVLIASEASGFISNLGQFFAYLKELFEIGLGATSYLLRNSYRHVCCQLIETVYEQVMQDSTLTKEEKNYLYEIKRQELLQLGKIHLFEAA